MASFWQSVFIGSENAQKTVRSWFSLVMDNDTRITKAEILLDRETEAELGQIRAYTDRHCYLRRRTKAGHNITIKPVKT